MATLEFEDEKFVLRMNPSEARHLMGVLNWGGAHGNSASRRWGSFLWAIKSPRIQNEKFIGDPSSSPSFDFLNKGE